MAAIDLAMTNPESGQQFVALETELRQTILGHLAKLSEYLPGPLKKVNGIKDDLLARYRQDPLFSMFGLDTREYVGLTLGGGTVTSIHRKLGDIYEGCVKQIFRHVHSLAAQDVVYSASISSGDEDETRSADVYLEFGRLREPFSTAVRNYCIGEMARISGNPKLELVGVAMEVRHCYQTGDSKRTQADEAMARHLLVSGILPVMPLFCNQSNEGVVRRYRSVWVIKQGMESYDMIKLMSGFDFYNFLLRNREAFRAPVLETLRKVTA